ncbi:hypothetical protein [Nannocystis pusilla]|uniref:Uncharacterized protein n=1 Tax=Nannocystis pusilla TaxID=889268 RepID=A0ABS7TPD6_9BACT|nr:hypothetical protein [Nannocystis pusilla]MBZ5710083.1 hypothetical protein [Nannocystis pusilla]
MQAFDVLDTAALAGRCQHLRARLLALRPDFAALWHHRQHPRLHAPRSAS